jgi:hypothetical protein
MAYELPGQVATFTAAADLSAKQYYFVKITADNTVNVCAAVTDIPIGVLQNAPASGEAASVMLYGISKVSANEAIAVASNIGTGDDGQADVVAAGTDTTVRICGQALEAAGAAGEVISCAINCINGARAA